MAKTAGLSKEVEEFIKRTVEEKVQKAVEEFVKRNEIRAKEYSILERLARLEEELVATRKEMVVRFEEMDKRFKDQQFFMKELVESLRQEVNARIEALQQSVNARIDETNARIEALEQSVNARIEALDKRLTFTHWLIGIVLGIPAFTIAIIRLVEFLSR